MTNRPDETWHRLLDWTYGQAQSERLSAQILMSEGFVGVDPSHPLGGPDGGKDAVCHRDGKKWIMAVYFPRGKQSLGAIKKKLLGDAQGVAANEADALAFVTNQELSLGDRSELAAAAHPVPVELYHLERVAGILDKPAMAAVRKQFLFIDGGASERLAELQLAEAEARQRIYPRLVPAGFSWSGGRGCLRFEVQNEGDSLFRVVAGSCRWWLDHDLLHAWTTKAHVRLLRDPAEYLQEVQLDPCVVRQGTPLVVSLDVSATDLHAHFQAAARSSIEGVTSTALPAIDLVRGEAHVRCEPLVGLGEQTVRFALRWGS